MKQVIRLGAVTLLLALSLAVQTLPAQTLDQAEALWKARRYNDANEIFKQLVALQPKNADFRVRWGRMYLDHSQPSDARDLFAEALEIKKDHAGALLGLALVAAQNFEHRAADLARKALESDPGLLEAQELLARLALGSCHGYPAILPLPRRAAAPRPSRTRLHAVLFWLHRRRHL